MAGLHKAIASASEIKFSHWPRKPEVGIASCCITARSVRENEALVRRLSRRHTMTTVPRSDANIACMLQFATAHRCKRSTSCSRNRSCARKALDAAAEQVEQDIS